MCDTDAQHRERQFFDRLPQNIQDEFQTQYLRLRAPACALRFWERHLFNSDRARWNDDINVAYRECGGTIGIAHQVFGGTGLQLIAELAHHLNFAHTQTYQWLVRSIGRDPYAPSLLERPRWDFETGELWLGEQQIRRLRLLNSSKLVPILNSFQESGWQRSVPDPLPDGPDAERLYDAARSLNTGLKLIRFRTVGSEAEDFVCWERL